MARPPAGPRAPGPAVLVAGAGTAGLAAAQGAVRRATGLPGAAVVGLQYASCGSATGSATATATDGEVRFVRGGRGADDATWWEARGCTPAQAMVSNWAVPHKDDEGPVCCRCAAGVLPV